MPQRAFWIWEILFGLLLVLALAAAGYDARSASRRGGPWKRRLLAAGLWAWAFLAVAPGALAEEAALFGGKDEKKVLDPETERALVKILIAQPGWDHIEKVRREAWDAVLGSGIGKGPSPSILAELTVSLELESGQIERIASRKALSTAEAAYLREEIHFLLDAARRLEAYRKNPLSFRRHEAPNPSRFALEYLRRTASPLEVLASAETVRGKVLEEVLPRLDACLRALEEMEMRFNVPQRDFDEARRLRGTGSQVLGKLRETARPPLDRNPLWKSFRGVWEKTKNIIADHDLRKNLTAARKRKVLESLKPAFRLMDELEKAGVLTSAEKQLLRELYACDYQAVEKLPVVPVARPGPRPTCYSPAPGGIAATSGEASARALEARLPLLRRLAEQNTVRQEVLAKLMETLEAHLRFLADPELKKRYPLREWEDYERTFKQARKLVIEVKAR